MAQVKTEEANGDVVVRKSVRKSVKQKAKRMLGRTLSGVSQKPPMQQLTIGGVGGWLTGYILMKFGKKASLALGGGIILLQIATHKGYVTTNWDLIQQDVRNVKVNMDVATTVIDEMADTGGPGLTYMWSGFAAGFFIGLGSA